MPTLLIWRGHKFRFYASDMQEPPHVHIMKDGKAAKVWLRDLDVEYRHGYNKREMRELLAVVAEKQHAWIGLWNEFFGF
jgi:Domain of unknown function (DUF4160)